MRLSEKPLAPGTLITFAPLEFDLQAFRGLRAKPLADENLHVPAGGERLDV